MRRLSTSTLFGIAVLQALLLAWGVWSLTNGPAMAPDGFAQRGPMEDRAPAAAAQRTASRSTPTPAPVYGMPLDTDVRSATRPTLDPDGPVGIILTGVVRRTTGEPLPGAQVRVAPVAEDVDWNAIRWARQGGDAGFAVVGLRPGRWKVQASAEGHVSEERELEFETGEARRHVEFTLAKVPTATLTILDGLGEAYVPDHSDLGLPEADEAWQRWPRVLVSTAEPGRRLHHETLGLGQRGRFEPDEQLAPAWGRIAAQDDLPLFVSVVVGDRALATLTWTTDDESLLLRLPRASLREAVMAPTIEVVEGSSGRMVSGASVGYWPYDGRPSEHPELRTDATGRVQLAPQPRRALSLWASHDDLGGGSVSGEFAAGSAETVRIALHARRTISGRLLDAQGAPAYAQLKSVALDLLEARAQGLRQEGWSEPDGDGHFEFGASARPYMVWAFRWPSDEHPGGSVSRIVDPSEHSIDDLELRLQPIEMLQVVKPGARRLILRGADGRAVCWWPEYGVSDRIPIPMGAWTLETWRAGDLLGAEAIRIPYTGTSPVILP